MICWIIIDKESAEAMVSNFEYNFRERDPDKRLRVTAIIDKTITEAENKI